MNVVRFYETLAKIIGERENVEIRVNVREVMKSDCSVQASTNGPCSHAAEFKFPAGYGAGLTGHRENLDGLDKARRAGRARKDRQRVDCGTESGSRLVGA